MWTAETSASAQPLDEVIAQPPEAWAEGALFSFERGLEGEFLLAEGAIELECYSAAPPAVSEAAFEGLLAAFGMNPMTNYRYKHRARRLAPARSTARAGLELTGEGALVYRDSLADELGGVEIDCSSDADAIEQLRRLVELTAGEFAGEFAGEARIALRSAERTADGVEVRFGYVLGGAEGVRRAGGRGRRCLW